MNHIYEKIPITFNSTIFGCLIGAVGVKYMLKIYENRLFNIKKGRRHMK